MMSSTTFFPLMPMKNLQRDDRDQRALEALYRLDGRESPLHPQHATYTGLAQGYPSFTRWILQFIP